MKDIIYIKDLRVKTIIGIFDWERKTKQEVSIDMEFPFDCKKAAKTDSIEDTIDYKTICKAVIKFVEESSFQLQESLAEGIASLVKDTYGVESIKVVNSETILKPVLEMPKEIEPESDFKVNVSEIKGKSMTYTIAVVDPVFEI